eukprot:26470-Prymnesium_polylepis.1
MIGASGGLFVGSRGRPSAVTVRFVAMQRVLAVTREVAFTTCKSDTPTSQNIYQTSVPKTPKMSVWVHRGHTH